jgi:outer membrane protein assembly factor BamB
MIDKKFNGEIMCCLSKRSIVLVCLLMLAPFAFAADWPQWRGPNHNGSTEALDLPGKWTLEKNTKWSIDLPGTGSGTPIVSNDRVFISSTDTATGDLLGMCFNAATGKELWRKKISTKIRKIPRDGDMAASSPSTDGQRVYFTFENGVIAAFDYDGNFKWKRKLEDEYSSVHIKFGYSSTPLLFDGKMFVQVMRRPTINQGDSSKPLDSFILAIDPVTGKNIYKQLREFKVIEETYESYSSPTPFIHNGRKEVLVNAVENITSHDPATGKVLWQYQYTLEPMKWGRNISSLVTGNGMIFGVRERGNGLYALKGGATGVVEEKDIAWTFDGPCPDVSTPLFYQNRLYVFDGKKKKTITCLNPQNGDVIWTGEPGGKSPWRASLTAADGKIYCTNEKGLVIVLDAKADKYKEICRVNLAAKDTRASISIADDCLYIRTAGKLYCIGK